ncbi:hypothetical protein Drorol1_Dr00018741 [Drosera rotundifolia]
MDISKLCGVVAEVSPISRRRLGLDLSCALRVAGSRLPSFYCVCVVVIGSLLLLFVVSCSVGPSSAWRNESSLAAEFEISVAMEFGCILGFELLVH